MFDKIKEAVYSTTMHLCDNGILKQSQGNVSVIDRNNSIIAIKPSGVNYNDLVAENIVITSLEGTVIEGNLKPSVDLPTHIVLYEHFPQIESIIHTHSHWATVFAQAGLSIPLIGTTHADDFLSDIPCTDYIEPLIDDDYEVRTGFSICNYFDSIDYFSTPAILIKGHGAFIWGETVNRAEKLAIDLEEIASLAWHTLLINPSVLKIPETISRKHYSRKNGRNAYYGQGG